MPHETFPFCWRVAPEGRIHLLGICRGLPKAEYICSEYVAGCFQTLGLDFPWDGLGFLAPVNIAAHADVKAVAQVAT